jgi:hypothetical protein
VDTLADVISYIDSGSPDILAVLNSATQWSSATRFFAYLALAGIGMDAADIAATGLFNLKLGLNLVDTSAPDMVDFTMLEAVLEDDAHPQFAETRTAWEANYQIWTDYNNDVAAAVPAFAYPDQGVVCALATYCTFNEGLVMRALSLYGLHLISSYGTAIPEPPAHTVFTTVSDAGVTADGDYDGDGFSDLAEWVFYGDPAAFAALADKEDFFGIQIQNDREIAVSFADGYLVDGDAPDALEAWKPETFQQRIFLNLLDYIPTQSGDERDILDGRGAQEAENILLKLFRVSFSGLCKRHFDPADKAASAAFHPWHGPPYDDFLVAHGRCLKVPRATPAVNDIPAVTYRTPKLFFRFNFQNYSAAFKTTGCRLVALQAESMIKFT